MGKRLSVLIPSREEPFLLNTIQDVLAHRQDDTEIIVILDGKWPVEPIPDHPDVHLVYHPVSIGQRAATNEAARIARGDFVMKLDAHCALDDGFDVKLLAPYDSGELDRRATSIPAQHRLHVYDRICPVCAKRIDQGPLVGLCDGCGQQVSYRTEMVWQPRKTPSTSWVLDADLHFQYDKRDKCRLNRGIKDVMTSLGACVLMRRDRFFEIGGLDESIGSWGQYGQELACKSWLSGGRHVCNTNTWFAHFFRVGGIGFPYPIKGSDQERARKRARRIWMHNAWPSQTKPLSWLVRKFEPVVSKDGPRWEPQPPAPQPGIVYYTSHQIDPDLMQKCQRQLQESAGDIPIVSVSLKPLEFGQNIVLDADPSRLTMFRQILAGLEASTADYVFLCEHDCLYPKEHFAIIPPRDDRFYYDQAVWRVDVPTGKAVTYSMMSVSGCCANRTLLVDYYRRFVAEVEAHGYDHRHGYEPGVKEGLAVGWKADTPYLDLRHGDNLTASRWSPEAFTDKSTCREWQEADTVPGWPAMAALTGA